MTVSTPISTPSNLRPARRLKADKYAQLFRWIHEHRAGTLTTLTGALVLLPALSEAQTTGQAAGSVALSDVPGVASYVVRDNGSVEVTLTNGQTVVITAGNVVEVTAGDVIVSQASADEVGALLAGGGGGAGGFAGPGAAAGALALLAGLGLAGGGGGGGGGSSSGGSSTAISKTITVVDAPLEEALVFYDANDDDVPEQVEYLGVTDENGAVQVTYEPTPNGKFIILPAPVADAASYGWSQSFIDQVSDFVTRDIVTDNVFTQILEAPDAGQTTDQVVSPISTLVSAGVPEATVKALLGIPDATDLNTFNFFEALSSNDPVEQAAAQNASTAAVLAANVVQAALAAAETNGPLSAAQVAATTASAVQALAEVVKNVPANTDIKAITEVATAVAVASAVSTEVDAAEQTAAAQAAAAVLTQQVQADPNSVDADAASSAAIQNLQTGGNLTPEQAAGADAAADAFGDSADDVEQAFENLVQTIADGADTDAIEAALKADLDAADDALDAGVQQAINEEVLGLNLVADIEQATEGQQAFIKGNIFENDGLANGDELPSLTTLFSVNGTEVPDVIQGTTQAAYFATTSDWGWFSRTVALDNRDGVGDLPSARGTGGNPTRGSAITKTITVEAGTTLTLDYVFGSRDYVPYNDYSFLAVTATDGGTAAEQNGVVLRGRDDINSRFTDQDGLADVADIKGGGFYTAAGQWRSKTYDNEMVYTFEEAGTYEIAIGVTDVRDTIVDSFIWVTDIELTSLDGEGNPQTEKLDGFARLGNAFEGGTVAEEIAALVVTGFYGTLIIDQSGDFLYQVGGENAEPIPEGVVVTDNFTYRAEVPDGNSGFTYANQQIQIQVTGVADPEDQAPTIQLDVSAVNADSVDEVAISGQTGNAEDGIVTLIISDGDDSTPDITVEGVSLEEDGSFTTSVDLSSLSDGTITVGATVSVGEFVSSASTTTDLDTTADAAPALTVVATPNSDNTQATITVTGLDADADAVVSFTAPAGGSPIATLDVADNGVFTLSLAEFMPGVEYAASITVSDAAGNSAILAGPTLTVPVPPEPPTVSVSTDTAVNAAEAGSLEVFVTTTNGQGNSVQVTISDGNAATGDIVTVVPMTSSGQESFTVDVSGLTDGPVTVNALVNVDGLTATATPVTIDLDTTADAAPGVTATISARTDSSVTLSFDGFDADLVAATVTLSGPGGANQTQTLNANGSLTFDLTGFAPDVNLTTAIAVNDDAGNIANLTGPLVPTSFEVQNTSRDTPTFFSSLADAVADAQPGETLLIAGGVTLEEDVVIDKPLVIQGVNAQTKAFMLAEDGTPILDTTEDGPGTRGSESTLEGTLTVASNNVTISGMTLASPEEGGAPLTWDESLLATSGALDNFALNNTILVGYDAVDAPVFNAGSDVQRGTYTGETVASGWSFSGNMIGGVTSGTGGSMYLSGLDGLAMTDNLFLRPAAGHLYMSSIDNSTVNGNTFFHGVHAGGIDLDGLGQFFEGQNGYGYGYGGGTPDEGQTYLGRNFWIELKGDNDGLTIDGNSGKFNSGGIQIFGEDDGYSFDNITISNNSFGDFINADPSQLVDLSGFMGAVAVSVGPNSDASNIVITGNTVSAAADQVFAAKDQVSLISVQGNVTGATVDGNQITWVPTSSATILNEIAQLTDPDAMSSYTGPFVGVALAGGIDGQVAVTGNTVGELLPDGTLIAGLFIDGGETGNGPGAFGALSAAVTESGNTFNDQVTDVVIEDLPPTYDLADLSFATMDLFVVNDGALVPLTIGVPDELFGTFNYSGTAGADAVYADATDFPGIVNITQGGADLLFVNADPVFSGPGIGPAVEGFVAGTSPDADTLLLYNIPESVSGNGEFVQVTNGSTIGDGASLLVFTTPFEGGPTADQLKPALESLVGADPGESFYIATETVGNNVIPGTTFYLATFDENGEASWSNPIAELRDVSAADLVADNVFPSVSTLPEV